MRGKKRVLILTSSFPSGPDDVAGRFVLDLGTGLSRHDSDVFVLAPHAPGYRREEIVEGVEVRRFRYAFPEGMEKLSGRALLPLISSNPILWFLLPSFFLSQVLSALRLIKEKQIDLINSHWLLPQGLVGAIVGRITGTPHVLTTHSAGFYAAERLPFGRRITNYIVKNSARITAVSSYTMDKLLSSIPANHLPSVKEKAILAPMGVDVDRFQRYDRDELRAQRELAQDTILLLYVGRLEEIKGVDYLIRATKTLNAKQDRVRLWIVGEGHARTGLERLVKDLGLDSAVSFMGQRVGDELNSIFVVSDIVVVPSLVLPDGSTEGLPVVILEAMAAGKPVVASSVGGIPDAVENEKTGLLVQERSQEQLSAALERLVKDVKLCNAIAERARAKALADYSWETISRRFNSMFEEVIERGI